MEILSPFHRIIMTKKSGFSNVIDRLNKFDNMSIEFQSRDFIWCISNTDNNGARIVASRGWTMEKPLHYQMILTKSISFNFFKVFWQTFDQVSMISRGLLKLQKFWGKRMRRGCFRKKIRDESRLFRDTIMKAHWRRGSVPSCLIRAVVSPAPGKRRPIRGMKIILTNFFTFPILALFSSLRRYSETMGPPLSSQQ